MNGRRNYLRPRSLLCCNYKCWFSTLSTRYVCTVCHTRRCYWVFVFTSYGFHESDFSIAIKRPERNATPRATPNFLRSSSEPIVTPALTITIIDEIPAAIKPLMKRNATDCCLDNILFITTWEINNE